MAMAMEFELTKDPATNTVPRERLLPAYRELQRREQLLSTRNNILQMNWEERGPNNVGGRTRALLLDANDPSGNTLWAGSVSGGLFKTTNISASTPQWQPVNDLFDNLSVTAIAQDPTNPQTMYFATGEGFFNADAMRGFGIWKSTNGGTSWQPLPSTQNSRFHYTQKLVVNSQGTLFAATRNDGLVRSNNGGTTWTRVLGGGTFGTRLQASDVEIAANGVLFASLGLQGQDGIYRSTDQGNTWAKLSTGLPSSGYERIELACAPSDPNRVYAMFQDGNNSNCQGIYRSNNGGNTWTAVSNPGAWGMSNFCRGQAWYDLTCAVDPNNANTLMIGGIDLLRSTDGGNSWSQVSQWFGGGGFQYVHADQHIILYAPGSSSTVFFGNDGGVYRSTNGGITIQDRNRGYNVTQFYACAIHPVSGVDYFIAGAQDNGTQQFDTPGINATDEVAGGDGAFVHIDEDQPDIQIAAYVYQNYFITTNSWASSRSAGDGTDNGEFINPTDYDSRSNTLYCAYGNGNFFRISNIGSFEQEDIVQIPAFNGSQIRHVSVSPNVNNRVYFGLSSGRIVRVDNANSASPSGTVLNPSGGPNGSISCIAVEKGNENHLLVTLSNYGVVSVWESYNAGGAWFNREGDLPDMPVRWALFNPNDANQALLGTELGVWVTSNLNNNAVQWVPSNNGLPNTRVSMLQIREDQTVLAGTYGRGLFTSSSLEIPTVGFTQNQAFVKESSTSGRVDDCQGYLDVVLPLQVSAEPSQPTPVLLKAGPATTLSATDYQILPSSLFVFAPGQGLIQNVTVRIFNDGIVEGTEFLDLQLELPVGGRLSLTPLPNSFLVINDGLITFDKVATALGDQEKHPLGPNQTRFFHLANEKLLAKVENLSGHDFGCMSIEIDREGNGASAFQDDRNPAGFLADKTFLLQADNPDSTAQVRLSLYYTAQEIDGWKASTSNDGLSQLLMLQSPGAISRVSPETLTPDGPVLRHAAIAQNTSAAHLVITATISGSLGGIGIGKPGQQDASASLVLEGEPQKESNRLFWNLAAGQNLSYFQPEKWDGSEWQPLDTLQGDPSRLAYESFDLAPTEGSNRYRLYARDPGNNWAFSNEVELFWVPQPDQASLVAPNPFDNTLSLFPGNEDVPYAVRLFNISGQLVAETSFTSDGAFVWDLSSRELAPGIYVLELRTGDQEPKLVKLLKR